MKNFFGPPLCSSLAFGMLLMTFGIASGQEELPSAPVPATTQGKPVHTPPDAQWGYFSRIGVMCGVGASNSSVGTKPTVGCGAGMSFVPLPIYFEFGVMGPQANRSYVSGYISVDGDIPLGPVKTYTPVAIIGYSRLFETGHALDYGVGLALPRFVNKGDGSGSMRIELRDYWTFANPNQHNVMLRVGFMDVLRD